MICCAATMLTACSDLIEAFRDNPVTPSEEEEKIVDVPPQEIDPNEFQPIDISVALLGSLSNYAEEEVLRYWFTDVHGQVTNETMVVITDEITPANEAAIVSVLDRYGVLLLVDPNEDNVRQYGEYFGVDPSDDYSKLELLGLTGFGDKFVSYAGDNESASNESLAPASIASDDIWDVAPEEYLRLKAFAQWVDRIDKKYTEYQKYLEDYAQAIIDSDDDEESASRALTRNDDKEEDLSGIINIINLPGEDLCAQAIKTEKFKSYDNAGRSRDEDWCPLSVTCNYHIKPLFEFPSEKSPGADYYIVEASVNWDCTETFMGFKFHDHGSGTDRRSYLFFPIQCKFWSEPITTSGNYQVMVTTNGELWPGDVIPEKEVTNSRSFNIDGNVSGGISGGGEKGSFTGGGADGTSKGSNIGANLDLGLGIGASWSKQESFTTAQYEVSPYRGGTNGAFVGHVISVPGGEDGWRPRKGDPYFEVPGGVNFRKTIPVTESWIWKVSGTQVDTYDNALTIQFMAEPTVAWYSYFLRSASIDEELSTAQIPGNKVSVSAPNRQDAGFLKILANTEENGKGLKIFGVKATDVTNAEKKVVVYDMPASTKFGKDLTVGLPANKTYDIELQMGTKRSNPKTYILKGWKVAGHFNTVELETDTDFDLVEE